MQTPLQKSDRSLRDGETIPEGDSSVAAKGEVYCYWEEVNEQSIVCYRTLCNKLQEKRNDGGKQKGCQSFL